MYAVLAASVLFGVFGTASAAAADFTWSGGGGGASAWSNPANWLGGSGPSSGASIGTLNFPKLASAVSSTNDLSGVSVEQLQFDNSRGGVLTGNPLTLGSGGLNFNASERPPINGTEIANPLTLAGDQTWEVAAPTPTEYRPDGIAVRGQLSNEAANLTINLNTFTQLQLTGTGSELGTVTINGSDTAIPFGEEVEVFKSAVGLPHGLNGSDGKQLTLHDIILIGSGPVGPIAATSGSEVDLSGSNLGAITATGSAVDINGDVASLALDPGSVLQYTGVSGGGAELLTSSGVVNLGGARLFLGSVLGAPLGSSTCPAPSVGQLHTLISTSGSLLDTFANAPDGGTVFSAPCVGVSEARWYPFRINYHTTSSPKTLTATALPAVPGPLNLEISSSGPVPPTISGSAVVGQTLTETNGAWTNEPTSYADQWERCDSAGASCAPIASATAQSYTLGAADVGSTIRVGETASNSEGSSLPALSPPTAVVQALNPGGGSHTGSEAEHPTGGGGGPSIGPGGGLDIVVPPHNTSGISATQIMALLKQQLMPSGKASKIRALLKHGGLSLPVQGLGAGTLTVQWFVVPPGAKLAKRAKAKPLLVAAGKLTLAPAGAGTLKLHLTAAGRRLLGRARRLKVIARGAFVASSGTSVSATKALLLSH
jgi:hypothetical protein